MASKMQASSSPRAIIRVIVVSLLIDLLAFTLPLPLFPRIIQGYIERESPRNPGSASLLTALLSALAAARSWLQGTGITASHALVQDVSKADIVLLGGLLGSLFSFCQFLVSPSIGRLSDVHGRRPVLLASMLGNIASSILWLFSPSFTLYLLSRIVGGLAEGNVQLSIAVLSDVTNEQERARALALVGMCFAVAFSVGPPVGALLASKWDAWTSSAVAGRSPSLTQYAVPAMGGTALLVIETAYLAYALPETKNFRLDEAQSKNDGDARMVQPKVKPLADRKKRLARLQSLLLVFSFIFSGAEFTLTFLTFDLFSFTNAQNGRLLGVIGVLSSLFQGGVVRRQSARFGSGPLARSGLLSCVGALALLARLPHAGAAGPRTVLWAAAACFAWSSASVVNSLNALASLECDEPASSSAAAQAGAGNDGLSLPKGQTLGRFRSAGQLGRALGPLSVTASYWAVGPSATYAACAVLTAGVWLASSSTLARNQEKLDAKKQ